MYVDYNHNNTPIIKLVYVLLSHDIYMLKYYNTPIIELVYACVFNI